MLSLDLFSYASAFQQQQSYLHQAIFIQAQIILKRIFVYLSFSYVLCFLSGLSFRLFWRKTRKWRRDIHSFWKSRRRYCPPYIFCRGYYPISCGHISCTSSWRYILVTCFPSYKERSCKHRAQILVYTTYNFVRCQIEKTRREITNRSHSQLAWISSAFRTVRRHKKNFCLPKISVKANFRTQHTADSLGNKERLKSSRLSLKFECAARGCKKT